LAAVLNLVAVAVLSGLRSLHAIAQFGRSLSPALARQLGFTHAKTPCKSTLSVVLRAPDAAALEEQLRSWAPRHDDGCGPLAVGGKAVRGSADGEAAAVHLLAVYAVRAGITLAQQSVSDKTNEHKAALDLLRQVPVAGRVVRGDAMFTHRDFGATVLEGGGDYVLPAKDNQPTLVRDIKAAFTPAAGLPPPRQQALLAADQQQARDTTKGHGRLEQRALRTLTVLNDYLDWPGVGQVFWLRRERAQGGKTTVEDVYGVTSLTREAADAGHLLELLRGHWGIENGLHYVRDVTLAEDGCRVRKGAAPTTLAGLRSAALVLVRQLNLASIAEASRACAFRPKLAIRLVLGRQ
jgi:predicted transposase YbfD/YdcC